MDKKLLNAYNNFSLITKVVIKRTNKTIPELGLDELVKMMKRSYNTIKC